MFPLVPFSLLSVLLSSIVLADAAVPVAVPATPSGSTIVHSNFLGISFELSFMTDYFGNDTANINTPMLNYLAGIRARTGGNPMRIRIGGNSADSSPYESEASSPMVALQAGNFNSNDQPVTYNSMLWSVMANVSNSVGGVAFVINIPLAIQPNASLSTDIRTILGSALDSMLLGNEPDLYSGHGKRPNLKNYTVEDYFGEYAAAIKTIGPDDSQGIQDIGGPSACCAWHYPQNNCNPGVFPFQLPWYLQHSNVVTLAQWQKPGIDYLLSQSGDRPQLINSEFNSASCGGVPFSPSFGVGSLWSVDYALQMATVGYTQAYLHTREAGISYNLLAPPSGPPGSPGPWTTNSPYYSLLTVAEALRTEHGAIVADLNLGGSMTNPAATTSAYAVYNADNKTVSRLALFNWANTTTQFVLPASVFNSEGTALVKFLAAATPEEETNISWGGETWGPGVSDGKSTLTPDWAVPNQNLTGCAKDGCTFTAPGPSLAMVFLDNAQFENAASSGPSNDNTNANSSSSGNGNVSGTGSGSSSASSPSAAGGGASGQSGAAAVRLTPAAAFGAVLSLGFVLL
ncbi:hypothetical protein GGX14DRAFT_423589 [Mycena pura]|uniref:Beta-glucuronidase C-terminal domain-containing protein n=1 Tax=Mycena pura TaxID=153505 RepID=A0AAD7E394_9AGAR|nr:hypothetical protein GGX14DRAFT_423589 [Mycena pura]